MPNKKLKCRHCGEYFDRKTMVKVPLGYFCSFEHATKHGQDKGRKVKEKAQRKELKERKEKVKTMTKLCSEAQVEVNRVRLRQDILAGHRCISCLERPPENAGHFYHAGSKYRISWLRFLDINITGECIHCNQHSGDHLQGYQKNYIDRYGQAQWDRLVEFKRRTDAGEIAPPTREEVTALKKEKAAEARLLLKEMKVRGLVD